MELIYNKITHINIINKICQFLIILMLYSNFILIIKNKDLLQKNQPFYNSTKIVPKKHNIYSDLSKSNLKLYNSMEHPYFSIILLYHKDFRINDHKLTNLIVNLLSQTFIDIQIIIFYDTTFVNIKALISNLSFFNKSLLVYPLYNMHWVNKLNYIINVINGKYLIVLDDFLKLQRDELYNAYNITKGKKDNILLLESLYQQFEYFNITFIKMDNRFNKAFTSRYLTSHAYYRYSLGELIPNLDKILFVLKI